MVIRIFAYQENNTHGDPKPRGLGGMVSRVNPRRDLFFKEV